MGNCHPEKTNVDRGAAEVDIVLGFFESILFNDPLRRINIYTCIKITFGAF